MNGYSQFGMTPGVTDPNAVPELAFSEAEYKRRQDTLRALMRREGIDLLYVTTPDAVAWLHGFYCGWYKANGPMRYPQIYGTAIHAHSDAMIHFDNPTEAALLKTMSVCKDNRYYTTRDGKTNLRFIMGELEREGLLKGTVGMEFWSYVPNRAISHMIEDAFRENGCEVKDASVIAREARRVKSAAELDVIREAIRICDIGHQAILEHARVGRTELDVMGAVNHEMMKAGGELPALIHVFNGAHLVDGRVAATGHSMPTTRKLEPGMLLAADLCGVKHRYHGNVLRGFYIGEPPKHLVDIYDRAAGAIAMAQRSFKANMTVREVNTALKQYCEESGLAKEEGWILGYELGLSLPPDWVGDFFFNMLDVEYLDRSFEPGMVTNLEILYGTALIDTLFWGVDGIENPTTTPCRLLTLPA
ncbi:Xaa-Pro aminopeptidase [Rhodoligotrophos appendicifer]|uniref:M24 family metallopeptidase n=1 Tax=Rhodoligotrophos appendicifer TaxID=987056 RepID=UPI0011852708|nr:M24 family metallopeptidase [Rhodoligotrophos appendicifer]